LHIEVYTATVQSLARPKSTLDRGIQSATEMLLVPSLEKGARVLPIVLTAHPGVAGLCLLTLVEYFAKSLTVIENGTIRNFGYDFLFAFRSKYMAVSVAVTTQYTNVTDIRQTPHRPRLRIASRDKMSKTKPRR